MTKETKVSAWTPTEDILMIFSVMEQKVREENKEEKISNLEKSETDRIPKDFQMEFKNGILSPIKNNLPNSVRYSMDEIWNTDQNELDNENFNAEFNDNLSQVKAHLFKEVCECGRNRLRTKTNNDDLDSLDNLINCSTQNLISSDAHLTQNRSENICIMFIIIVFLITIFFLFFIRNFDLIMNNGSNENM